MNSGFRFALLDPGTLTVEFTGESPLADGSRTVKPGQVVVATKPGRYPFKCTLVRPDGTVVVLDPTTGGAAVGGELEVPSGP